MSRQSVPLENPTQSIVPPDMGIHEQWVYEGKDFKNTYLYFEDQS
jgi:hypothetical protein